MSNYPAGAWEYFESIDRPEELCDRDCEYCVKVPCVYDEHEEDE